MRSASRLRLTSLDQVMYMAETIVEGDSPSPVAVDGLGMLIYSSRHPEVRFVQGNQFDLGNISLIGISLISSEKQSIGTVVPLAH